MAKTEKTTSKPKDVIDAGIKASLALGAEQPWAEITLAKIADKSGLTLADFYGKADKVSLSDAIEGWFDKAMSAEAADMDDSPRERLFEVIMLRFEAMEPYRDGLLSLMKWRGRSPARLAALLIARRRTAEWALACAGLDTSGEVPLAAKTLNMGWVISRSERAWRKEESADFARTMAMLDAELRGSEERLGWVDRLRGRRRKTPEADAADTDTV